MFYENKPEFFILYNETTALQYPLHIHSILNMSMLSQAS